MRDRSWRLRTVTGAEVRERERRQRPSGPEQKKNPRGSTRSAWSSSGVKRETSRCFKGCKQLSLWRGSVHMSEQIPQRQTSLHITHYLFGLSSTSRALSPNNTHTNTHSGADRTHADGRCRACLRQLGSAGPRGQRTPLRCFCCPTCTGQSWLSGSAAERDKTTASNA